VNPYLFAQGTIPARTPLRSHANAPRLKLSDPALRAMSDFLHEPPLTVYEDYGLEEAIDHMFRLGMRAILVVRERSVVGLITSADAARSASRHLRVADVMTLTDNVPAIGWDTLREARVSDLIEIFEGTGVEHLVVLENHSASLSSVRGLIHRERVERQLRSPSSLLT
jgi:CBS domain-containing protein